MIAKQYMLASGSESHCKNHRKLKYEDNAAAKAHVLKAMAVKKAMYGLFHGVSKAQISAELETDFADIPYYNPLQRAEHLESSQNELFRYYDSVMARGLTYAPVKGRVVILPGEAGEDLEVEVSPDFIRVDKTGSVPVVELIKVKVSKPSLAQGSAKEDLELYALYKLAEKYVIATGNCIVKATIHFLRRNDDRGKTANEPHFEPDFFAAKGGGNVVSVAFEYTNGIPTELDVLGHNLFVMYEDAMKKRVSQYIEGTEPNECTKEDCAKCDLYSICRYTHAPLRIDKVSAAKGLKNIRPGKEQKMAINFRKGVLRCNAGAGAGKTTVVALRAASLIAKGVKPEELLLITFTNAGAEEMRTRIELYLKDYGLSVDASKLFVMTFNAFGDIIVAKEYKQFGFSEPPKVIDDIERTELIVRLLEKHQVKGLDYKNFTTDMPQCRGAVRMAREIFRIIKAYGLGFSDTDKVMEKLGGDSRFVTREAVEELVRLYDEYDETLRTENLIEYEDQMVKVEELLMTDPHYLESFGFKHVIVDEFQDTSLQQIDLVRRLTISPSFESLMVVGDDSQAIYSFRDTTPEYIINFDKYIGTDVEDVFIVENRRSTPQIIGLANKINARNVNRIDKDLVATRPDGKPVEVKGFFDKDEEREYVIDGIKRQIASGVKPEDIAVICATRTELFKMADLLTEAGIASVLLNPERLLENGRIRAAIALVSYLEAPNDLDLLTYINGKLGGGIMEKDDAEIKKLMEDEAEELKKFTRFIQPVDQRDFIIKRMKELDLDNDEIFQSFIKTLERKNLERMEDYIRDFYEFGGDAAQRRVHDYPGVVLTTAHSSKGLEWNVVYAMISGFDGRGLDFNAVEEKRRLLFVTITRARDELCVTGQYISGGKKGAYTLNRFLKDCIESDTGKPLDAGVVWSAKETHDQIKKAAKKAAANP